MEEPGPLFVRTVRELHLGKRVEVWFEDESRFGQQGSLTRVWALKGSRPSAVRQTEYQWVYLYGAVNPLTGQSVGLLAPTVNTDLMSGYLAMLGQELAPDVHAILILDRAGWHVARDLKVPENMTLYPLPPYSPELNPTERLWWYFQDHDGYDDLFATAGDSWNRLTPEQIQSICRTDWLTNHY